jgi:hypothetical protein
MYDYEGERPKRRRHPVDRLSLPPKQFHEYIRHLLRDNKKKRKPPPLSSDFTAAQPAFIKALAQTRSNSRAWHQFMRVVQWGAEE